MDRGALRAGVDSAADRLLTALRTNASDSLMALMADDIVLMPPNEAVLRGKPAVRAWYDRLADPAAHVRPDDQRSRGLRRRGVGNRGRWLRMDAGAGGGGPAVVDRGSYMQLWHREPDGRWRFSRELWNSAAPPAAPKAP